MSEPWSAEGVPRRELDDPRVLRALAHPVRWRLLDSLLIYGQATATELAERLDESPSNCSWHLRQLAKYGFVEEAEGGTGRQRPWRFVPQTTGLVDAAGDPELSRANETFVDLLMRRDLRYLEDWRAGEHQEPETWQQAAFINTSNYIWLSPQELRAFKEELGELVERHLASRVERLDPARRPAGTRPMQFTAWGVPSGPSHPGEPATPPDPASGSTDRGAQDVIGDC